MVRFVYPYFSKNGQLLPIEKAIVSLSNIEYTYGFGVYENIRVAKGTIFFLAEHIDRLVESAQSIQLEHSFSHTEIDEWVRALVEKNQVDVSNIKMLLIGAPTKEDVAVYIQCLPPLFPEKKLYTQGAEVLSVRAERLLPHAKTLNMLPSYLAYRQAKQRGCYDALLVDSHGSITEGTRANFFVIKDKTLYSPPAQDILLGVTRHHVLKVAQQHGYAIKEKQISLDELSQYDGAFLTSTSAKIMPLKKIDDVVYPEITAALKELMKAFTDYLAAYCSSKTIRTKL